MNTIKRTFPFPLILILTLATVLVGSFAPSASAQQLVFSTAAPTPGPEDIHNFTGANRDGLNVNSDGAAWNDGGDNDAYTYVAHDRFHQGQTFTTGSAGPGYLLSSFWVRHVDYDSDVNDNTTWWNFSTDTVITARVTDPSAADTAGFVLRSEDFTISEVPNPPGSGVQNNLSGTGVWLQFSLESPIELAPDSLYGFDLNIFSSYFFELHGINESVFAGGGAYGGAGGGDFNAFVGDRVFLAELAVIPEPSTYAGILGLFSLAGVVFFRARRRRTA